MADSEHVERTRGADADLLAAVGQLQPVLDRVRSGAWRVLVVGCANARERDTATMFPTRLLDLADALDAWKGAL